jgi:hypothetical protein
MVHASFDGRYPRDRSHAFVNNVPAIDAPIYRPVAAQEPGAYHSMASPTEGTGGRGYVGDHGRTAQASLSPRASCGLDSTNVAQASLHASAAGGETLSLLLENMGRLNCAQRPSTPRRLPAYRALPLD